MNLSRGNLAVIVISDYEFFISREFLTDFIIESVTFKQFIAIKSENVFDLFNVHSDKIVFIGNIVDHVLTAVIIFGVVPDFLIKGLIFLGNNNGISYAECRDNADYKEKRNYSADKPFLLSKNCNASAKIRQNKNKGGNYFSEMSIFS